MAKGASYKSEELEAIALSHTQLICRSPGLDEISLQSYM